MLKRIVEHDDITPSPLRIDRAGETIGRDHDGHVWVEGTMDERFVLTVASQDDRGLGARTFETAREVRSERSLARASHREVPDAQRGNSRWVHAENARREKRGSRRGDDAEGDFGGRERRPGNARANTVARPQRVQPVAVTHVRLRRAHRSAATRTVALLLRLRAPTLLRRSSATYRRRARD